MRRIEHLISLSRSATENEVVGTQSGINSDEFVRFLNDGKERIESLIAKTNNTAFTVETFLTPVAAQEEYDVPSDIFINHHLATLEYSPTGLVKDYYYLNKVTLQERSSGPGSPANYIVRKRTLLINPVLESAVGSFRLNYTQAHARLDIRRGTVGAVTLNSGARTITTLTLSTSFTPTLSDANFTKDDYLTVVDRDGVIKMDAIPYSAVNTSSGAVTVVSGFVYGVGETIAVGDYVCLGTRSTTQCTLPDITEKYLLAYCDWKILKRDSSDDAGDQNKEMAVMEEDIISAFVEETDDVTYIPIISDEFF